MPDLPPRGHSPRRIAITLAIAVVAIVVAFWLWPQGADGGSDETPEDSDAAAVAMHAAKSRPRFPDLAPEARARIEGTITEKGGGPLAGAKVCATPRGGDLHGLARPDPVCTTSGKDGDYAVDGLLAVRHGVVAGGPGLKPAAYEYDGPDGEKTEQVPLEPGKTRTGVDIELERGGVLMTGVVKDIGGGEIEGALVRTSGGEWFSGGPGLPSVTGPDGSFEAWVEAGRVSLRARAEGYASSDEAAVAPGEFVEIELVPESVLVGIVVHVETGEPVAGVEVSAWEGNNSWSAVDTTLTDDSGHFRLERLAPGRYKPYAKAPELFGEAPEQVMLGFGQTSEPVVVEVHPAVEVEGHVVVAGSDARVCLRPMVSLREKNAGRDDESGRVDADGTVRFLGLLPGIYEVGVSCKGFVPEARYDDIELLTSARGIEWTVREGMAIRGTLVDSNGSSPTGEFRVFARMNVGDDPRGVNSESWSEVEGDGSFELPGLAAGTYSVRAWGKRPGPDEPVEVEVESGRDTTGVVLEIPNVGNIAGFVVDEDGAPVGGVDVRTKLLESTGNSGWISARTDDSGAFLLENVRVGRHRVVASEGWSESLRAPGTNDDDIQGEVTDVNVGATAEVRLVVRRHSETIAGRVLDENGEPVADAFVYATREAESATSNEKRTSNMARWGSWAVDPVLTDQEGRFAVEALEEGVYGIQANRKGGGEGVVSGVKTGSRGVEVVIESTGDMSGSVTLSGGGSPDRFSVSIFDKEQGLYYSDDFFRTKGHWKLTELSPGTFEVTVTAAEGDAKREGVVLEGGADKTNVDVELTAKVRLRGRLVDGDTNDPVAGFTVSIGTGSFSFGGPQTGNREEVSDANGHFVIARASAGKKVGLVAAPMNFDSDQYDFLWKWIVVPATPADQDLGDIPVFKRRLKSNEHAGDLGFKTKERDPTEEPDQFRFVVGFVRPGGPAAEAGLAVDDEIVSVDGHDVGGREAGRFETLTSVPTGTKVRLGLQTGDSVEIIVGPPQ